MQSNCLATWRGNTCSKRALCNTLLRPHIKRKAVEFPEEMPTEAAVGVIVQGTFALSTLKIPEFCTKTGRCVLKWRATGFTKVEFTEEENA